jgi:hypothetical protein
MTELADSEIRPQSRLGAVALVYCTRLLSALLVGAPIAGALGATGVAQFPNGDAILFEPGAVHLVEALRVGAPSLIAASQAAGLVLLVASVLSLVPLAALLVALCHGGRLGLGGWAGRTAERLPTFALLWGMTLLGQGCVLFIAVVGADALRDALLARVSERTADCVFLVLVVFGLVAALALGVLQDLGRSAAVRHGVGWRTAVLVAVDVARRNAPRILVGWAAPAIASVLAVGLFAAIVGALHIERGGELRLFGVVVAHQLAAFATALLRAVWLCTALRLVGPRVPRASFSPLPPASDDKSEDSAAPGDPSPSPGA